MKFDEDYQSYSSWAGVKNAKPLVRCFETHKPLTIGEYQIYGGSCSSPIVKDADVYIGFDHSMTMTENSWPWKENPSTEVYFHITDMQAPSNAKDFLQLIAWTAEQLKAGKKVHAGCIGGHGRTGTFLAALVTHMTGMKDSITYVRTHYCKKAVESTVQIAFLGKHFGILPAEPSKGGFGSYPKNAKQKQLFDSKPFTSPKSAGSPGKVVSSSSKSKPSAQSIQPVSSMKSIWIKPRTPETI